MEQEQRSIILKGVAYGLVGTFFMVVTNALAKEVSQYHHAFEIVFFRHFVGAAFLCGLAVVIGKKEYLKTDDRKGHLIRAVLGSGTLFTLFTSLSYMPITEATTLFMTAPFFVAILSYPLLKEKISISHIVGITLAMVGVYFIMQPETISSTKGALFALAAAFFNAAVAVCLRLLGKKQNPFTTTFYFAALGSVMTLPMAIYFWSWPSVHTIILLGSIGLSSVVLQYFYTKMYVNLPASMGSSFLYFTLIWSAILDLAIWGVLPKQGVVIGAFIIFIANLIMIILPTIKRR